jgi:hypothetical protein
MRFYLIIILLFFIAIDQSFGQRKNKSLIRNSFATVSFGGGSSHYFGDLSPYSTVYYGLITTPRWNATANYTLHLNERLGVRLNVSYIRLMGDDYTYSKWDIDQFYIRLFRNLHFRNDLKEFSLLASYNLIPHYNRSVLNRNKWVPYVFLGFGMYQHNPKAKTQPVGNTASKWVDLGGLRTSDQVEAYSRLQIVAPLGLGIRKKINENFDLTIEGGFRITPFDYLDDVGSKDYVSPASLGSTEQKNLSDRSTEITNARTGEDRTALFLEAAALVGKGISSPSAATGTNKVAGFGVSDRFSSKLWDSYATTQITLTYYIHPKLKCPPLK